MLDRERDTDTGCLHGVESVDPPLEARDRKDFFTDAALEIVGPEPAGRGDLLGESRHDALGCLRAWA